MRRSTSNRSISTLPATIRLPPTDLFIEFKQTFHLLGSQPLMGQSREDLAANLRSFSVGNYVILYRPAQSGIKVARVLHAAPVGFSIESDRKTKPVSNKDG